MGFIKILAVWLLVLTQCLKKNNSWHEKKKRESCKYFQFLFWGGEMMAARAKLKQKRSIAGVSLA